MNTIYYDDDDNRCCRIIILNKLKHMFVDTCSRNDIMTYRTYVLTFLPQSVTQNRLNTSSLVSINDDDFNRLFGWAINKLTTKYLKGKGHSVIYKVSIGKFVVNNISK